MRTLLLNYSYESIQFISLRKALKLIVKEKVEVLSNWDELLQFGNGEMPRPSIVRLKYYVPRHVKKQRYNRTGILKRDRLVCQYCGKTFKMSELTIDHVTPKRMGGKNSWLNCVACCYNCNNKKADRTPKQAKMKLLRKPFAPALTVRHELDTIKHIHPDWKTYIYKEY